VGAAVENANNTGPEVSLLVMQYNTTNRIKVGRAK